MRVVVTGGRGLIGREAVRHLSLAGHHVVSVVRSPATGSSPPVGVEEVLGDAGNPAVLANVLPGSDVVVHLAAIPSPVGHSAVELILANSVMTVAVLEQAAAAGVAGVVLASSISALGMAWSPELLHPLYLPVDEDHPLRPVEGYALSKECDEAMARMASRRWGMGTVALRLPFTQTREQIRLRAADRSPENLEAMAKELWAYLDVNDAARVILQAVTSLANGTINGAHVVNVMADRTILNEPLGELMQRWYPDFAGPIPSDGGAYDTSEARRLLGFAAEAIL